MSSASPRSAGKTALHPAVVAGHGRCEHLVATRVSNQRGDAFPHVLRHHERMQQKHRLAGAQVYRCALVMLPDTKGDTAGTASGSIGSAMVLALMVSTITSTAFAPRSGRGQPTSDNCRVRGHRRRLVVPRIWRVATRPTRNRLATVLPRSWTTYRRRNRISRGERRCNSVAASSEAARLRDSTSSPRTAVIWNPPRRGLTWSCLYMPARRVGPPAPAQKERFLATLARG